MIEAVYLIIAFLTLAVGFALFLFYSSKSKTDKSQNEAIKDLERRITDLMISQMKEIRDTQNGTSKVLNEQMRSFTKETTEIRENLKQIKEKVQDVSSFQQIFKSPKLRGQWGEASLEYILTQHFPAELWKRQFTFLSGETVDAILKLPNGKILPVDSKFSSENFERMIHASDPENKKSHRENFLRDIKNRVDEISEKYIKPSEGTIDFALMYIPAEAIYYEIMFGLRERDVANYAWKKKVVLTSPNTVYLTLRTITQWFKDTQISRKTQEILKRLGRISQDSHKLACTFQKLGTHLKNALSAYDTSEKRIGLFSDRVEKLLETKENKKLKKP